MADSSPFERFALPYPPSLNHLYAYTNGRVYLKPAARRYKKAAFWTIKEQMGRACWFSPLKGFVHVRLLIAPPDKAKRDIDNLLKLIFDSGTDAGLWIDDCQIIHCELWRLDPAAGGQVALLVRPYQPELDERLQEVTT